MAGAGTSGLISAGISQASGLAGALSQIGAYKRAENSTKRLTEWNYLNSPTMMKQGMKNAGLSTAGFGSENMQGTEVSQPQPRDMSGAFGNLQQGFGQMSNQLLNLAQVKNVEADTKKKETEANLNVVNADNVAAQTRKLKLFMSSELKNIQASTKKMLSESDLNREQKKLVTQETQNAYETMLSIRVERDLTASQRDQIQELIRGIRSENDIKAVQARLARDFGITTDDGFANLLNVMLLGKGDNVIQALKESITDIVKALPEALADIWSTLFGKGSAIGDSVSEFLDLVRGNAYDAANHLRGTLKNRIVNPFDKAFRTYPGFRQFHSKE